MIFAVITPSLRILRRAPIDRQPCQFYPAKKPSVLDHRLPGDCWVAQQTDGSFGVFVGSLRLASLGGNAFDWMTLNELLARLRGQ